MDEIAAGNEKHFSLFRGVWTVAGFFAIAAAALYIVNQARLLRTSEAKFSTSYQAVLLTNGSVYFGKLQGYGGPSPVLTQVYYVASQTDPATKQVTNTLVKRGKEMHEPDRMYLNPQQILFVETVGPHSIIAQKIAEQGG